MKHNVLSDVLNAAGEDGKLVRALLVRANDHLMADEGVAYVFRDVRWYMDDEDIAALYKLLSSIDDEDDYIVIEACHDYPDSDEGDAGCWTDNPWNAQRITHVTIEFDNC
jgi:hypothetical protein